MVSGRLRCETACKSSCTCTCIILYTCVMSWVESSAMILLTDNKMWCVCVCVCVDLSSGPSARLR